MKASIKKVSQKQQTKQYSVRLVFDDDKKSQEPQFPKGLALGVPSLHLGV